jgi:hypothetical protein
LLTLEHKVNIASKKVLHHNKIETDKIFERQDFLVLYHLSPISMFI